MSKGTLSFNLPEEKSEFEMAQNAYKYQAVLYNIDQQYLRPVTKHGITTDQIKDVKEALHNDYPNINAPTDEQLDAVISILFQAFRDKFYEYMNDEGVDIV